MLGDIIVAVDNKSVSISKTVPFFYLCILICCLLIEDARLSIIYH